MRNYIVIFLAVFFVIVGGGGVIGWFVQAAHTKALIEDAVAEFNKGPAQLTYDALETWGFPSKLHVTLVRPRLRINMPAGQWSEDIMFNGNLTIGVNVFSDHYMLAANGPWKRQSTFTDKTIAIEGKSDGDIFFCNLHMKRGLQWLSARLWDIESLQRHQEQFLEDMRLLDCAAPGTHMIYDQKSGALLMQNSPARFYINREPKDGLRQTRFYFNSGEMEVSPQGNEIIAAYGDPVALNLHALGKMKIEADLTYQGDPEFTAGDLAIDSLDFSAAPYGLACRGNIKRQPNAALPSGKLTITCTNCLRLVDDMTDYANHAQKAAQAMRPDMPVATLRAEGFKTFLRTLAGPDAETRNDFIYNIISDEEAGLIINGKPLREVMALYQQMMAPPPAKPAQ